MESKRQDTNSEGGVEEVKGGFEERKGERFQEEEDGADDDVLGFDTGNRQRSSPGTPGARKEEIPDKGRDTGNRQDSSPGIPGARKEDILDKGVVDTESADLSSAVSETSSRVLSKTFASEEPRRVVPSQVPEVHIIGEISSGVGFGSGVSCRWRIEHGELWSFLEGSQTGHTQTGYSHNGHMHDPVFWNHPIDVHYRTSSVQGWPRLVVQVQQLDAYGLVHIVGYGLSNFPTTSGCYDFDLPCWRPIGSHPKDSPNQIAHRQMTAFFLGKTPQLLDDSIISRKAFTERCRLVTESSGKVKLKVSILTRYFDDFDQIQH